MRASPRHPRSVLLTLAVVAVMSLVAMGCGGSDGDSDTSKGGEAKTTSCPVDALKDAKGKVEITFWHIFTATAKRTMDAIVAAYNASQDKVVVNAQSQGVSFDEVLRKFKLAAEDGKGMPNLLELDDTSTQLMADSGVVVSGQDCYDADPSSKEIFDDLLPLGVSSYSIDGRFLPVAMDPYTALEFHNRTHFTKAGLDPDDPPGTWPELRAAAEKLKAANLTNGNPPIVLQLPAWQFEWWMSGIGQPIVNEDNGRDGLADKSEFGSKAANDLLVYLKAMEADGLLRAIEGKDGQTDHLFAMALGNASITMDSSAGVPTIAGLLEGTIDPEQLKEELGVSLPAGFKLDIDLGVGQWPGVKEAGQGQVGGGVLYLVKTGSKEQQAATWDFVKYFNSVPVQVKWALEGTGMPSRLAAANDPALQEKWSTTLGGKWSKVAWSVLQNVREDFPGPLIGPYKETREVIKTAVERSLLGDGNIDAALKDADTGITKLLKDYKTSVGS